MKLTVALALVVLGVVPGLVLDLVSPPGLPVVVALLLSWSVSH